MPRGTLERPVVAEAPQTPDHARDIEPVEANHVRPAEIDDRGEDQRRENREVAFTDPGYAVLERDLDHADGALRAVREAFLDLGIVGVGIERAQEDGAHALDVGHRYSLMPACAVRRYARE